MKADKTNIKNTELMKPAIWKTEMAFFNPFAPKYDI